MNKKIASITGLLGVACWSCVSFLVALAAPASPLLVVGLGSLASFAGFYAYERASGQGGLTMPRGGARALLVGLVGNGLYRGLYWSALLMAPPVEAAVLLFTFPVLAGAGGQLVRAGYLCTRHLGAAIAILLALFMVFQDGRPVLAGHVMAFAGAIVWGVYIVRAQKNPAYGGKTVTLSYLISGLVCLGLWAVCGGVLPPASASWLLIALAGLCGCGGYVLWDIGKKDGDITLLSRAALFLPLLSMLALTGGFGWPGPGVAGAAALVFAGGVMVSPLMDSGAAKSEDSGQVIAEDA